MKYYIIFSFEYTHKFMKMNGRNLHMNERFVMDARITVKVPSELE